MTCQHARDIFPELLDRRTAATSHLDVRAHLANCPECQQQFAALTQTAATLDAMPTPRPTPSLRKNFYAMLEEEKRTVLNASPSPSEPARVSPVRWWRWVVSPLAACALLLLGFALGQRSAPNAASPASTNDDPTRRELVALREQMAQQRDQLAQQNARLEKMTTVVSWSILQQQQSPANERLNEVLAAAKEEKPSAKILDDLISALTLDPSANVRLRAIEALYRHADREIVRAGVLAALPREQNPLVQLELIDFVATAHDGNATPVLEKLSADESADHAVREAAKLALAQL